jgi:hypothetical protein
LAGKEEESMLAIDARVTVTCTETNKIAGAKIVRIHGNRVDIVLDQGGGDVIISLSKHKPNFYVGSRSGLEFTMRT